MNHYRRYKMAAVASDLKFIQQTFIWTSRGVEKSYRYHSQLHYDFHVEPSEIRPDNLNAIKLFREIANKVLRDCSHLPTLFFWNNPGYTSYWLSKFNYFLDNFYSNCDAEVGDRRKSMFEGLKHILTNDFDPGKLVPTDNTGILPIMRFYNLDHKAGEIASIYIAIHTAIDKVYGVLNIEEPHRPVMRM